MSRRDAEQRLLTIYQEMECLSDKYSPDRAWLKKGEEAPEVWLEYQDDTFDPNELWLAQYDETTAKSWHQTVSDGCFVFIYEYEPLPGLDDASHPTEMNRDE